MIENFDSTIDIFEQHVYDISPKLLDILLKDRTTNDYITWACDDYSKYGPKYNKDKSILPELILVNNSSVIQPRVVKDKQEQQNRVKTHAEVFTPLFICNEMNNFCDDEWFGYKNVFNISDGEKWITNIEKINFKDKDWKDYVKLLKLEITCGEAPFLTSRYDVVTGDFLSIENRVGLLDRKIRVINENVENKEEWFKWVKTAFESTYGFEYQGDNLIIARENLLWTFIENYKYKYQSNPDLSKIEQIADIISWNIWQMDGLTNSVPFKEKKIVANINLLGEETIQVEPILSQIKNWRNGKVIIFNEIRR